MTLFDPSDAPPLSYGLARLFGQLTAGLRNVLGDNLVSFYSYGALAFPRPPQWRTDIDFHVLLARELTDDQRIGVQQLHRELATFGYDLDGYYLLVGDAHEASPPTSQVTGLPATGAPEYATDGAWALHRAHVLAGRFLLFAGTDPRPLLVTPTWAEMTDALNAEMAYVEAHPEHASFGILNSCRVLRSCVRRDVVVSKYDAAIWGLRELPTRWHACIDAAVRAYSESATASDTETIEADHGAFVAFVRERLGRLSR